MRVWRGDESAEERAAAASDAASRGASLPAVVALAGACLRSARRRAVEGVYPVELAFLDACMEAVQSLPYVEDAAGSDSLRDPDETIAEGGDCEDLAALLVALARCGARLLALRVSACVVWIAQPKWPTDHVSAWVSSGLCDLRGARVIEQGTEPPAWAWWAECSVRAARGESPYAALARVGGASHARIKGARKNAR